MNDPDGNRVSDGNRVANDSWVKRAERYADTLPRELRKRSGAWFTPMQLALPTAMRTLEPVLAGEARRPIRICDPAVGGGTFLLAALRTLTGRGMTPADATACLCGLDTDPEAARLAALAIEHEAGFPADVRHGDGLLELERETLDCVLTNPPWETMQTGPDARARVARLRPHFEHQGRGKLFTYRLFVERAVQLLRPGGRLGMVVPASLWFDRDAEPLRRLLLDTCDWQWLFGFENRGKVFAIDSRYRFGVIIATKGGATERVQVAFGRTALADWGARRPEHVVYRRDELRSLSRHSGAFVEVEHRRDLDILRRMHERGEARIGDGRTFAWRQGDFNMTKDRDRFVPREQAERDGYQNDGGGVFRSPGRPDLLPLQQGAMLHDLDANHGAHAQGTGHKTRWRSPARPDELRPQYLVDADGWRDGSGDRPAQRIALRALSNATNQRTAIACLLPDVPCGNSLGVVTLRDPAATRTPLRDLAAAAAVLSSLPFDWALRMRLGGTNLNGFVLADCVLPRLEEPAATRLATAALRLCATLPWHASLLRDAALEQWGRGARPAIATDTRRQLHAEIDLVVGDAFGLDASDVAWITRGCRAGEASFAKGFWRVDRDLPEEQRRPVRWRDATRQK